MGAAGGLLDAFPAFLVHDADRVEETAVWVWAAMADGMAPLVHPVSIEVEVAAGPTRGG